MTSGVKNEVLHSQNTVASVSEGLVLYLVGHLLNFVEHKASNDSHTHIIFGTEKEKYTKVTNRGGKMVK